MIVITNDDGYRSHGIRILYRAAVEVFGPDKVAVVAPDKMQSLSGMGFTVHKPLRLFNIVYEDMPCTTVSGTPADCIFVSESYLFKNKIEMVLSGVNAGTNLSAESVYGSGTVSAAVCAALYGIKAIAFSKNVSIDMDPDSIDKDLDTVSARLKYLLKKLDGKRFPNDVDLLNINFPAKTANDTPIKVTTLQRRIFENKVTKRKDPRGKDYFWLNGKLKKNLQKGSDAEGLYGGNITVSPIRVYPVPEKGLGEIKKILE